MTNKGHQSEHDFVDMIRNWHKVIYKNAKNFTL